MSNNFIFSSESVGEGHPDKVCDTISDYVLDACLAQDKFSRVACECYAKSNVVIVGGEITIPKIGYANPSEVIDFIGIARQAIRDIGYVQRRRCVPCGQGVRELPDHRAVAGHRAGRGRPQSQGQEDREARRGRPGPDVRLRLQRDAGADARADHVRASARARADPRSARPARCRGCGPDAKSQVSVVYDDGKPVAITNVVISTQHAADVGARARSRSSASRTSSRRCCRKAAHGQDGVPDQPDRPLCGRRAAGRHGLDRAARSSWTATAAWAGTAAARSPARTRRRWTAAPPTWARWVAKNVVAAGLAAKCEVQFAYAIGHPDPVSVHVDTFGTATVSRKPDRARHQPRVQLPAGGHHRATQPAPPDLRQDHQLRPLRQERPGHHLGEDRQGRNALQRRPPCGEASKPPDASACQCEIS